MDLKNFIYIFRHGESLEDVDKTVFERMSDPEIPLSNKGISQALDLGDKLSKKIKSHNVQFYLAPSKRVLQTAELFASKLAVGTKIEFKTFKILRKQDWGKVKPIERPRIERERYETGILRYNFKKGESAKSFIGRLADFVQMIRQDSFSHDVTRIIITHGFEMRIVMMHMFGWSENYFELLAHPDRCEAKKITITSDRVFKLESKMRVFDPSKNPDFIPRKSK